MRVRSRNDTHPRTPHTYMHPRTRSPHCLHPRTRSTHFLIHSVPLPQEQAFYAKHDPSKTKDEIRELVRKYKKGNSSPPPPPTHPFSPSICILVLCNCVLRPDAYPCKTTNRQIPGAVSPTPQQVQRASCIVRAFRL